MFVAYKNSQTALVLGNKQECQPCAQAVIDTD